MSSIIKTQIGALTDYCDKYGEETWKPNHLDAMECRDIEDAIAWAAEIYDRLNRGLRESKEVSPDFAICFIDAIRGWSETAQKILKAARRLREADGFEVDGEDTLKSIYKSFSVDYAPYLNRLESSATLFAGGNTKPLREVINDIPRLSE